MKRALVPSRGPIGLTLAAKAIDRGAVYVSFPTFPPGREYPRVVAVTQDSPAYDAGIRVNCQIVALNGHSLCKKDISTVLSDFEYEKRCGKWLEIAFR